jgi:RNA 2',3'-cyclic 3'-phosphodiesterase
MRAFIAFEIPETVRTAVSAVANTFSRHAFLRIIPDRNMHVTIAFLGEITDDQAGEITVFLKKLQIQDNSSETVFDAMTCFPSMDRPRVVVLTGKNNDGKAEGLVREILHGLEQMKISFDRKPFKFHLTLARINHHSADIPHVLRQLSDRLAVLMNRSPLVIRDFRPYLFESILNKGSSPVYRRIG